ncbi:DUF410 domain-containing protein, partial [archaeon]
DLSTLLLQKVLAPTSAARPFSQPALRLCAALMALLVSPALVVSAAADEADALTRSAAVMSWINSLLAWSAAAVKSVPAPLAAQWRPSVQAFEATLHAAAARLYAAVVTRSISDAAAAASGGSEVPFSEGVATAVQQAIRHYCAAGDAQEVPSADSAAWRLDAPLPRADAAAAALAPPTDAPALGALSANMMQEFARFLGVCIAHMHVTEADAVLAGCVLRLAAAGNLRDANALRGSVLDMYDSAEAGGATRKAAIAKVLRDSPLSHFVKFLLLTLEVRASCAHVRARGRAHVCACVCVRVCVHCSATRPPCSRHCVTSTRRHWSAIPHMSSTYKPLACDTTRFSRPSLASQA